MTAADAVDAVLGENIAPEAPIRVNKPKNRATTVRIVLEESDDIPPSGLFLGVNGRGYMLKPGVEADIPLALKEVLDNAIISIPEVDPQTRRPVGWRNKTKYPYRIV